MRLAIAVIATAAAAIVTLITRATLGVITTTAGTTVIAIKRAALGTATTTLAAIIPALVATQVTGRAIARCTITRTCGTRTILAWTILTRACRATISTVIAVKRTAFGTAKATTFWARATVIAARSRAITIPAEITTVTLVTAVTLIAATFTAVTAVVATLATALTTSLTVSAAKATVGGALWTIFAVKTGAL